MMNARHTVPSLLALVLVMASIPSRAWAWGEDGHRIIAHIAETRLDNTTLATIRSLVGTESLAELSTWADEVRRSREYAWTAPLHYVNAPRGSLDVRRDRDCPDGRCVVGAIDRFALTVADNYAPIEARVEALKFLVHFVGDLHQPLHASYADDRGGNMIRVRFLGRDQNLHALWDSGLLRHHLTDGWERHAERLMVRATPDVVGEAIASLDPIDWACDSFGQTRTAVYALMNDSDELGQPYFDATIGIVDHQLTIGGYRLGAMLNALLGEGAPAPDAFARLEQAARLGSLRESMAPTSTLSAAGAAEAMWARVDGQAGTAVTFWAESPAREGDPSVAVVSLLATADRSDLHLLRIVGREHADAGRAMPFGVAERDAGRRGRNDTGWGATANDDGDPVFSPPRRRRGDVARAILYGSVLYQHALDADFETMLRLWHESDPPDAHERARNGVIRGIQGNGNRFIEEPWLVSRIGDF